MHAAFGTVVWIVCAVGLLAAVAALIAQRQDLGGVRQGPAADGARRSSRASEAPGLGGGAARARHRDPPAARGAQRPPAAPRRAADRRRAGADAADRPADRRRAARGDPRPRDRPQPSPRARRQAARSTSRPRSSARSPTCAVSDTPATDPPKRYAHRHMADPRSFELEELVNRPGTYFNPQTEVLVIVDDSPELDSEIFNMEEYEGADWVLISDEMPVDEHRRDELLERFQVHYHPGADHDGGRRRRPPTTNSKRTIRKSAGSRRRLAGCQPVLTAAATGLLRQLSGGCGGSAAGRGQPTGRQRAALHWPCSAGRPGRTACSAGGLPRSLRSTSPPRWPPARSRGTSCSLVVNSVNGRTLAGGWIVCGWFKFAYWRISPICAERSPPSTAGHLSGDGHRQRERQLAHGLVAVSRPDVDCRVLDLACDPAARRVRDAARELGRARDAER